MWEEPQEHAHTAAVHRPCRAQRGQLATVIQQVELNLLESFNLVLLSSAGSGRRPPHSPAQHDTRLGFDMGPRWQGACNT